MLLRAEPGKQKPRSCRTQELARSSGPRKCVAGKGWLTRLDESQHGQTTSTCGTKKRSRMYLRGCCPLEELHRRDQPGVCFRMLTAESCYLATINFIFLCLEVTGNGLKINRAE